MFGYPIGAHDGLPSDVGISGPMEARILGAGVVPFRRVGRVRTAPLQGDLRSTGTRRILQTNFGAATEFDTGISGGNRGGMPASELP